MIFESGLHVDFTMLKKVGPKASVVAVFGTFLPLLSGMFVMMLFDQERYTIWPVGLACGVTLAPTSVGMALKMLGERKQLGEEYGQLIVTAAFVDDILSLVALTMLLQIGISEASGEDLSMWGIFKPLVFSTVFCVGGALMAMPLPRSKEDGFAKKVLLRWIGIFPEYVPKIVVWAGRHGHTVDESAELQKAQDVILKEYGIVMKDAAHELLEIVRRENADIDGGNDGAISAKKIQDVDNDIDKDIAVGQAAFHELANARAMGEHDGHMTEADIAQGVVHGKAMLFESFLHHIGTLVEPLDHSVHLALDCMANAHERIHEKKHGEHKTQKSKDIEDSVVKKMEAWRSVHKIDSSGHRTLQEFKQETRIRTDIILSAALGEVKDAFQAISEASTPRKGGTAAAPMSGPLAALYQVADDKRHTGLLKLDAAMENVDADIDVIKVMNTVRSDIWDDWMGELITEMATTDRLNKGCIEIAEKLQHLQTHLFATRKGDIFDQHVHSADDILNFHGVDHLQKEHVDPLIAARMKWRGETAQDDDDPSDDEDEHGHGSHQSVDFDLENKVILTMMFGLLVGYGWIANEIGSHLLGAFIAGMSFCWMDAALMLWHSQVKRIANWLIRLFFGATVAFSIPINIMMDLDALWKGVILGVGPCCLTKIAAGLFTGVDKWVVGFAMVGRGEFAYLVAQTAQATLLNPASDGFAALATQQVAAGTLLANADGSFCVDGDCTTDAAAVVATGRRMLKAAATSEERWCKNCDVTGLCDETPVAGKIYWQPGQDCAEHELECSCEMMMPASAFSICVWALVMASVLAPVGFGAVLGGRIAVEKQQKKDAKKALKDADKAATAGAEEDVPPVANP